MADYTIAQNENVPNTMETRYRDMGDGTHALVVSFNGLTDIDSDNPIPVEFYRVFNYATLTYANSTDPTTFVDIQKYAGISIRIPAILNGLNVDVLFADDAEGTNAAIPKYLATDTWTAFVQMASVTTNERYVIQADAFGGPFFGLRISSAVTGDVTVGRKT